MEVRYVARHVDGNDLTIGGAFCSPTEIPLQQQAAMTNAVIRPRDNVVGRIKRNRAWHSGKQVQVLC